MFLETSFLNGGKHKIQTNVVIGAIPWRLVCDILTDMGCRLLDKAPNSGAAYSTGQTGLLLH